MVAVDRIDAATLRVALADVSTVDARRVLVAAGRATGVEVTDDALSGIRAGAP
ncbi:hypothetical protein [Micromonospora sp. KC207]|uniref:hypothetical protein n=1 Tax=Micromonospora sp. KC207 TaxID=2530377 RepID=UPI001404B950|nr:hypothetical protein [Micromonospora sp. KC207]